MKFFSRLTNLIQGTLTNWMGRRERRNPGAVYEAAIQARLEQYGSLRESAAGVLYMRGKLSGEVELKANALRSLTRQIDIAVERDEDDVAVVLIAQRRALKVEVDRVTAELKELHTEAEAAKKNLVAFQSDVIRLREEKVHAMARLANAKARLRLQETIKGLTPDADVQALEEVRAHIDRLSAEVQVSREVGDSELSERIEKVHEAEADAAARGELEELKRVKKRSLVRVDIPEPAKAAVPPSNGAPAS
ncbi:MAG: PspA/IM30 family protein [Candidatus Binatia bacterium]|nr:PspA/IM30 family protein [Candidatus Binatia bacterium]